MTAANSPRLLLLLYAITAFQLVAAPSDLRPSFGTNGRVLTPLGSSGWDVTMVVDGLSHILVATTSEEGVTGAENAVVFRYLENGTLDPDFGTAGKVVVPGIVAQDLVIQDDGRIIVEGSLGSEVAVFRLLADGTLDTSFSGDGIASTSFGVDSEGVSVALQGDGKIVASGRSNGDFLVLRFLNSGTLDSSFGTGGKVTTDFGGADFGNNVAVLGDGKILVSGDVAGGVGLARYLSNGTLDTSFGAGGQVLTSSVGGSNGSIWDMLVQSDGKIVVGGRTQLVDGFLMLRYNADGTLDTSLDGDGIVTTSFGGDTEGNGLALQSNGKLIIAGDTILSSNDSPFAVARYLPDGTLDASFDFDGKLTTSFSSADASIARVVVRPDGSIVGAGFVKNADGGYDIALVCYQGDSVVLGGSDDFNDNQRDYAKWAPGDYQINNARFLETTGRLEMRVDTPTIPISGDPNSDDSGARVWTRNRATANEAFDIVLDVHNSSQPMLVNSVGNPDAYDASSIGIVISSAQDIGDYLTLGLYRDVQNGPVILGELHVDGNEISEHVFMPNTGGSDASLRLSFDPATRRMTIYMDSSGSSDGFQWQSLGTIGIGALGGGSVANGVWSFGSDNSFYVGVSGFSTRLAVSPGQVYVDNFLVGAISPTGGPQVTLGQPSGFTTAGMVLNGTVNPNGVATTASFQYGLTTSYGSTAPLTLSPANGISPQNVTTTLSGLQAGATYHYRLVASNAGGTGQTSDGTFTITGSSMAPNVSAPQVTSVTTTTAILSGVLNRNGLTSTDSFELSTDGVTWTSVPVLVALQKQFIIQGDTVVAVFVSVAQVLGSPVGVTGGASGLNPATTYHSRLVSTSSAGTSTSAETLFTTLGDPPTAVTGNPGNVSGNSVTLNGAVNPNGRDTSIYFEYGTTTLYGLQTTTQNLSAGSGVVNVSAPISSLSSGTTYHCRIVAISNGGTANGADVAFTTNAGASAAPAVSTTTANTVTSNSALLNGTVNPKGGSTTVHFEYGTTPSLGSTTTDFGVGNVTTTFSTNFSLSGLAPGTTYYFRLVATNSLGSSNGTTLNFSTQPSPPGATTGEASPLSTTSAGLAGAVVAGNASTQVFFDYGTDGTNFPNSIAASPAIVTGASSTNVSVALDNLAQTTYFYRVRAVNAGGTTLGSTLSFQSAVISGLTQSLPQAQSGASGQLTVSLQPASEPLIGWRLSGEQLWRASGETVSGLTPSDRDIEFRPAPGYIQPPGETVAVTSGSPATEITRYYYDTTATGSGGITVTLKPDSITTGTGRGQWRLLGENDSQWRDSGATLSALIAGNYLIECKAVSDRTTPSPTTVIVSDGQTSAPTITYVLADSATGQAPSALSLSSVTDPSKPYVFSGQVRSRSGVGSGFVVLQRVVATAAHVVWDDGTLTSAQDLQWVFQRYNGQFEPTPITPRGYYLFDGYAAQRQADNSPGSSSPASQNLDVSALYFIENAGRGGYSGWLASDLAANEFLLSSADKMLVGYPVDGIALANNGIMHATPPANLVFTAAYLRTYSTTGIRSFGGNSGGPLCVQHSSGVWYPAAVYLGGTNQTIVRAIDSAVIDLFRRAEVSGNSGGNNTGGGITQTSVTTFGSTANPGALAVTISPAAAVSAGGGWRLSPETSYRQSGAQKSGLSAGTYVLQLTTVAGYQAPAPQSVTVTGGQLKGFTFTYAIALTAQESWRQTFFGITTSSGNAADSADPDGDGMTNLAEYTAGTNPNDRSDVFKVKTAQKSGSTFTLTTSGITGRTYALQRSTSLASISWSTVTTQGPLGSDGTVTLTDAATPAGTGFYRIQVTGP